MTLPELCRACEPDGTWWTECCNGSGGCSCQGLPINMGRCRECGGTKEQSRPGVNAESIRGLLFIGSGPEGGWLR
jgi:hypothetical protein